MAQSDPKKCGKMTVFRSDRHEDVAAMVFVTLVVVTVLVYMAYIVPTITLKAPSDGKIVSVAAVADTEVKKGDLLYTIEVKEKKYKDGKLEEKLVVKEIHAKTNGKVLSVSAKEGDEVKKDKQALLVLDHEKGTLP
ncbi:MAG: biotin/lipoyl-binding protein [Desulfovibrio sp.]|jgi:multidrug efflux pump subunit AcrA (membrane-fusion protein)|nr:biotin/lipoyl-binding protein [Desulfovibrio sp.]